MVPSKAAFDLIKESEGLILTAYLDTGNVPTIGYGTTRYPNGKKVQLADKITEEQAEEYLQYHVNMRATLTVNSCVKQKINQHQFDALVSFVYNIGGPAFANSTLLKKVNKDPKDSSIRDEFKKWVYDNGRIIKGLQKRRQKEADLYFKTL